MEVSEKLSSRAISVEHSPLYAVMDWAKGLPGVLHLNIGEPDFKTPEHIIEGAKQALDLGFIHYSSDIGNIRLKELIAEEIKREMGVDFDPESEILITAGAQAGLYVAILSLVNPGDKVIVFSPYYPPYVVDIKFAGGVPVFVPVREEKGFIPGPEETESKVTAKTKLMIINSPNNPTGAVDSEKCLEDLAEIAKRHNLLVISDEAYRKLTYDGLKHHSIVSLPGMKERTIVIHTFSKTYAMAGWRIGYLATNREFITQMLKMHHLINICVNTIAQNAAITALAGPQDCVREFAEEYDRRRKFMVKALNEIQGFKCRMPEGAFYVFPNTKELGLSSMELTKRLVVEARVITAPGSGFGIEGEGYLRISYAQPMEVLEEAVERIQKTVEKF